MTHRSFLGNLVTVVVWPMTIAFSAEPGFEEMNAAFGAPIWVDENLWDDPDQTVGERLQWPLESRTETDSSYRAYAGSKVRILGARPFSLALYGREGTPTQISMVFANKGDWAPPEGERGARADGYAKSIAADTQQIGGALTNLLGPPVKDRFGKAQNSRESVHRWDWKGIRFSLRRRAGNMSPCESFPRNCWMPIKPSGWRIPSSARSWRSGWSAAKTEMSF